MNHTVTRHPELSNCYVIRINQPKLPPTAYIIEEKPTRKVIAEYRKHARAHFSSITVK